MPELSPPPARDEFAAITAAPAWTRTQRLLLAAARAVAPRLIRALGRSLRIELPRGLPPAVLDTPSPPAIYVFWHRCLMPIAWYVRDSGMGVLVSQHFDGELISQAAQALGYRLFRGSSTRGGRNAMDEMIVALAAGQPIALTVDGPRGPVFQAKAGAIQLARATGAPIYAIHASMRSCWTTRSWDGFQIPKPFCRVLGAWAGPLYVASDSGPEQIEAARREMEATLNRLRRDNDAVFNPKEESQ
ncbi:MAG: lysophospholipid acyltransferase family protein [Terriglobales bacterium]